MMNPFAGYFRIVRAIEQARREGRTDEFIKAAKENAELQKLMLQPKRYETINGAGEIGWGAAMLCFAASSYASVVLPASPWRGRIGFAFLAIACAAMPLCLWASKRFVTWPRVGYVAFRRNKSWWIGIVTSMVIAAGISLALVHLMRPEMIHQAHAQAPYASAANPDTMSRRMRFVLLGNGLANALLYLMMNANSIREHRWKWLLPVLILIVTFGICYAVPGNFIEVSRPMTLFLGSIWLVSGVITLISFIRSHQPPFSPAE